MYIWVKITLEIKELRAGYGDLEIIHGINLTVEDKECGGNDEERHPERDMVQPQQEKCKQSAEHYEIAMCEVYDFHRSKNNV